MRINTGDGYNADVRMLMYTVSGKKETRMFSVIFPINSSNSDEIWHIVSWINLLQSDVNFSNLTWIMSLHYLVKREMIIAHILQ